MQRPSAPALFKALFSLCDGGTPMESRAGQVFQLIFMISPQAFFSLYLKGFSSSTGEKSGMVIGPHL